MTNEQWIIFFNNNIIPPYKTLDNYKSDRSSIVALLDYVTKHSTKDTFKYYNKVYNFLTNELPEAEKDMDVFFANLSDRPVNSLIEQSAKKFKKKMELRELSWKGFKELDTDEPDFFIS